MSLFKTPEYRTLMQEHIYQTINFLFKQDQEFALACEIKYIHFSPELPSSIKDKFDHTVLFIISGYAFESAQLEKGYFMFEAGFGSENFGSVVSIPLLAIKQIFVDENPIIINFATPAPQEEQEKKKESASKQSSMEALLNNPENKKFLKKKK